MIDTEILAAIDELKSGKAERCDGILAVLLTVLEKRVLGGEVPNFPM